MNAGGASGNSWVALWAEGLWRASWQGALFILVVWFVCRLFFRLPPAVRCWLWWLASLKLLVGLVWSTPLTLTLLSPPRQELPFPPPPRPPTRVAAVAVEDAMPRANPRARASVPLSSSVPHPSEPTVLSKAPRDPWQPWRSRIPVALMGAWLVGVTYSLRGAVRTWRAVSRLVREAQPADLPWVPEQAAHMAAALGVRRPPSLLESAAAPGPLVVGMFRPVVVLPAALERLSREELRMAVAHELAHIARWDLRLAVVPCLAQALFFFHPLAWLAGREWGLAREEACDAEALQVTNASSGAYGRLLLKLSEASKDTAGLPALAVAAHFTTLRRRLKTLRQLSPAPRRCLRGGFLVLGALGVAGIIPWRVTAVEMSPPPISRPSSTVLQGVKELDKAVTYTEPKIPLAELIRKVAADTGVRLTAARDVADEPVAVAVNGMPARELLEQLADLLEYRWGRRRSGVQEFRNMTAPNTSTPQHPNTPPLNARLNAVTFEIYQDLASKQREEALRQAQFADVRKRLMDETQRLYQVAALPQEQIQRILDENDQHQKDLARLNPEQQQALLNTPVGVERERRVSAAQRVWSPVSRGLALLLGRLSPQQWDLLISQPAVTFSTAPHPGELPMPVEIGDVFRAARPTTFPPGIRGRFEAPGEEERMRQREIRMQNEWGAAAGYRATFRLDLSPMSIGRSITLTATAEPVRAGGPNQAANFGGMGTSLFLSVRGTDLQANLAREDTPERRAALQKDPIVGVKKLFRLQTKPPLAPYAMTDNEEWSTRDLLGDLARTYGVNIISDRYYSAYAGAVAVGTLPNEPTALYTLLDLYFQKGYRWDHAGNLVRLRSRTWHIDRHREVPQRLVRRWQALMDAHGELTLDEYVAMASTLNDGQLDIVVALIDHGRLPGRETGNIYQVQSGRNVLRLYGLLSPVQRQALWRGQSIPVAAMTPAQRDLFMAQLQEINRSRTPPLDLEEAVSGSLSLAGKPMFLTIQHHGPVTSARTDRVTTPPAVPPVPLPPDASQSPPPAEQRPELARMPGSRSARAPDWVARYPVTQLQLHLQHGPRSVETVSLSVARPQ